MCYDEAALAAAMKLLCLHGFSQNADVMASKFAALLGQLAALHCFPELVYVDAPHVAVADFIDAESAVELGARGRALAWWGADGGGWAESAAVLHAAIEGPGGVDGVVGFSEGGAAATRLCAEQQGAVGLVVTLSGTVPRGGALASIATPSLHIFSEADSVVPAEETARLASLYTGAELFAHADGKHVIPRGAATAEALAAFLRKHEAPLDVDTALELEALQAIFEDDYRAESRRACSVRLNRPDAEGLERLKAPLWLCFTLPVCYPEAAAPSVRAWTPLGRLEVPAAAIDAQVSRSLEAATGGACIFDVVSEVAEWLVKYLESPQPPPVDAAADAPAALAAAPNAEHLPHLLRQLAGEAGAEPADAPAVTKGGRWHYTVGLVGKPSAGKSTWFNAACNASAETSDTPAAKVSEVPFTTIAPNRGKTSVRTQCPARDGMQPEVVSITVDVLDVAGLVPGAHEGLGRGNQFLADLCGADVLVHIVDASGRTDSGGNIVDPDGGMVDSAKDDVLWIFAELFEWILENVQAKRFSFDRRPDRLPQLFSGYQAKRTTVAAAFNLAGVDLAALQDADVDLDLSDDVIRRLVRAFLAVRFPCAVAANKADVPTSDTCIAKLRRYLDAEGGPGRPSLVLPTSAAVEVGLRQLEAAGTLSIGQGGEVALLASGELSAAAKATLTAAARCGVPITGPGAAQFEAGAGSRLVRIGQALERALALKPPVVAFPCWDVASCLAVPLSESASREGAPYGGSAQHFRDMLVLRPGTTVGELFAILLHAPYQLCGGEYVRAEGRPLLGGPKRQLRKEEAIDGSNCVLKFFSTRNGLRTGPLR